MGQTAEEAGALHEGVPPWMTTPIWRWITSRVTVAPITSKNMRGVVLHGGRFLDVALIEKYDRLRQANAPIAEEFADSGVAALLKAWRDDADEILQFIDYCLAEGTWNSGLASNPELERILRECRSAWAVGTRDGFPGLERRIPPGVQEAANHATTTTGAAGRRLSGAWHAAFGMNPDPSRAYSLAVKAVEDAAVPVASPSNKKATLGTVIAVLRTQGDWTLPFAREDEHVPNGDVLVGMMKTLWAGQVDRHGGSDVPEHREVTQEAAEAAVLLAVPLVQWFSSGAAARSRSI